MAWIKYIDLVKVATVRLPDFTSLRRDELAGILGVNTKWINESQAKGLKSNDDGKRGATYDLRVVVRFLIDERKQRTRGGDTEELRSQLLELDKELKELKLNSQRENLVDIHELTKQWQSAGLALRERLERVGINHPDVSQAIGEAVNDVLSELEIE